MERRHSDQQSLLHRRYMCIHVHTHAVLCLVAQSCLTLCDLVDCSLPGSSVHGDSPDEDTGVAYLALLQGIFQTQGSNPGLPHYRQILYQLSHQENPRILEWVARSFSKGSSRSRNQTRVSCIAGGFFFSWATREVHTHTHTFKWRRATHSSTFAWRIPWTEEPDKLQSIGSQRFQQNWCDLAQTHTYTHTLDNYIYIAIRLHNIYYIFRHKIHIIKYWIYYKIYILKDNYVNWNLLLCFRYMLYSAMFPLK